jgi:hypothetical protein
MNRRSVRRAFFSQSQKLRLRKIAARANVSIVEAQGASPLKEASDSPSSPRSPTGFDRFAGAEYQQPGA